MSRFSHSLTALVLGASLMAAANAAPVAAVQQRVTALGEAHMSEAVKLDPRLRNEFTRMLAPYSQQSRWLADYGTTSPAQALSVDGRNYLVFQGCKPHDCPAETYVVLYDTQAGKLTGGAFVRNQWTGSNITSSDIHWLGENSLDVARALAPYLY